MTKLVFFFNHEANYETLYTRGGQVRPLGKYLRPSKCLEKIVYETIHPQTREWENNISYIFTYFIAYIQSSYELYCYTVINLSVCV
jgi:hypothetical protein